MRDARAPPSSQRFTILVVDDNEANRLLAKSTLEDEGYRIVLANGGAEAIAAFEAERPDCILLDVRMPDIDGFVACERIRALPGGGQIPVIFLTALRDVETFDHALRAGGDDFLTKPVRPTELVIRVQTALKLRLLRSEVTEHYALLKRQRDDLMRLTLEKERLMAFVVHDLKNPVNAMDLHAQLLLRDRTLPNDARDSVLQIRVEARQLHRLILNLLDLSKADEGKLTAVRARVDLTALVRDVVAELEVGARQRNVEVRSSVDAPFGNADPDLLRRALANLVENAIRHAPAGTTVTVATLAQPGGVELVVTDQGAGVPAEMRERIFDPFVQLENSGRAARAGGRGLGLAFCRIVAEAHGGRISVEDGKPGAIFRLAVPNES